MRTETVRNVMAATRCAMFEFKSVCYIPLPAAGTDRVAGMVAVWFSLHERFISKNISLQLEGELDSLEADSWALVSSKREQQHRCEIQGNAFAFSVG